MRKLHRTCFQPSRRGNSIEFSRVLLAAKWRALNFPRFFVLFFFYSTPIAFTACVRKTKSSIPYNILCYTTFESRGRLGRSSLPRSRKKLGFWLECLDFWEPSPSIYAHEIPPSPFFGAGSALAACIGTFGMQCSSKKHSKINLELSGVHKLKPKRVDIFIRICRKVFRVGFKGGIGSGWHLRRWGHSFNKGDRRVPTRRIFWSCKF